jgi:hypothetical protein
MPTRGCAVMAARNASRTTNVRSTSGAAIHLLFVVCHTRRISLPIILGLSVWFPVDTCVQFLCLFWLRGALIRADFQFSPVSAN